MGITAGGNVCGNVDGIVCDAGVGGTSITDVTGGTAVDGSAVDGIFCDIAVVVVDVIAVTDGTISGNTTFVGHISCRGGEPH